MSSYLDTNVLARLLSGDPPEMAARAAAYLRAADDVILTDVIFAEVVFVLQSFYKVRPAEIAEFMRSVLAFPAIRCESVGRLLRALDVFENDRIDFAEAYLVARAEEDDSSSIVSFDRGIDRVRSVARVEP